MALQQQLGPGAAARLRVVRRGAEHRLRQRPAALQRRGAPGAAAEAAGGRPPARRRWPRSRAARAQRREGVVGDLARPGEVPQRLAQLVRARVRVARSSRSEKKQAPRARRSRSARAARRPDARGRPGGGPSSGRVVTEVQRDAPGAPAQRAAADPHDLAAGAQLVQPVRRVGPQPARQHVLLPQLRRERQALQRRQHVAQPVDAGARGRVAVDALPRRSEARQRLLADRLDLLAQHGQGRAPQRRSTSGSHHSRACRAGAARRAQVAGALELGERRAGVDTVPRVHLAGLEGTVRAREAAHQPQQRVRHVGQEGVGQPAGRHDAERVTVQPGVLGGEPALLAADAGAHGAAFVLQPRQPRARLGGRLSTLGGLRRRQVADAPQHVVQRVGVPRPKVLGAVLQVVLHLLQRAGVDEVAQLLLAQELAQQLAVQGQGDGAPLGRGRVALVHVGRHVVEEQRRGERRGGLRLDLHQRELSRAADRAAGPARPGTSSTSRRHSRYVSRITGNCGYRRATSSSDCALRRCCHSGVRRPG